ncbi:UNVERIFIED_CONTAM: hypothetical protein PYX00_000137 [Menopon gallinae]|uniref:MARVEL domain-containing protein n=1 Tax=Menopon gallinae TaxID=328185 RepID=A0AAW2I7Z2_9NEOP
MSMKEKAKKQVVNILEAIVNLIIMCLAMGRMCVDCTNGIRSQLVDATIFGYFAVNCLLVLAIFIEEQQFHKFWKLAVYLLGGVLFLISGALVLDFMTTREKHRLYSDDPGYYGNDYYTGILTAIGLLCIVMVVLYIVDMLLLFKKDIQNRG